MKYLRFFENYLHQPDRGKYTLPSGENVLVIRKAVLALLWTSEQRGLIQENLKGKNDYRPLLRLLR
jgi:hypothetical protein